MDDRMTNSVLVHFPVELKVFRCGDCLFVFVVYGVTNIIKNIMIYQTPLFCPSCGKKLNFGE